MIYNQIFKFFVLIFAFILFVQCKNEPKNIQLISANQNTEIPLEFASNIALAENDSTLFYSVKSGGEQQTFSIPKSEIPFTNVTILSASAIGYLDALNELKIVKNVYDADWIYNEKIQYKIQNQQITNQGNSGAINLEKILSSETDAIIAYSDPQKAKLFKSLQDAGVRIIFVDEHLEKTPLAKAEYLKLYGALTQKETVADSLFNQIKENYISLKNQALTLPQTPSVFCEIMRGDIWYMPGGKSFQAQYFEDAGADYVFKMNENEGSMHLNFEQVFAEAENADFWLNAADLGYLTQLDAAYKNHHWFAAYKNQQVYSFANRMNELGANDYFETGTVRADWVLKDLISIFHPEILANHELYFYKKLE